MPIRIGDNAIAETILRPGGMVAVDGERHSARATTGFVEVGTPLLITGGDNQGLVVIPLEQAPDRDSLPGLGQIVFSTYGDRIRAEKQHDAAAIAAARFARMVRLRRIGVPLGLAAGVLTVAVKLGAPQNWFTAELWLNTLGGLAAFCLFGWWWLPRVERGLADFDSTFTSFTIPTGALSLFGFAAILGWLTPQYGMAVGLVGATLGGGLLMMPLPLFLMFVGEGSETEIHDSVPMGGATGSDERK